MGREGHGACEDGVLLFVGAEGEGCGDAADSPEEVVFFARAGSDDLAVGKNHFDGEELVDD